MPAQITVTVAGSERTVAEQTTAGDLFEGDRSVVVARVNGQLRDLFHVLADGDVVEPVTIDSEDGLAVLRHSTAHVLAQAVQQANPDAKLGIGPPIRDGFYYDFDVETPFHPDDLKEAVYTMRYDQASAHYGDFGTFYTGMVGTLDEVLERVGIV